MRVSGRPGRTDPAVGRRVRSPSGLSGRRPAWPSAGRPGRPWPEWCVPGWPVAGLWCTIGPKNDVSQKRPERAASLNSGVFTFWISYVGQAGLWSDWRAAGRPVVGLAGRGRPPAGLVGRWPAWPDAVRRGWTASAWSALAGLWSATNRQDTSGSNTLASQPAAARRPLHRPTPRGD